MKELIHNQIQQALQAWPGLDGTIHGLRRIKQGKHGSRSSLFYSAKNRAFIPVESRLELAYCYQLESISSVLCYRAQSLRIPYRRFLYPDFLIFDMDRTPYVREVKPSCFVEEPKNKEAATYLKGVFGSVGIDFASVTELDFWRGTEKANRIMLYDRGGRLAPPSELLDCVVDVVREVDSTQRTIERIRSVLHLQKLSPHLLEAALFVGRLSCDFTKVIGRHTLVEVML